MTKTYQVTLTENQMREISSACNLLSRVQLGQWREIRDNLPLSKDIDYNQFYNDMDLIGAILSNHMLEGIDGIFSSLGIGHPSLPESNGVLYDIHKAFDHKLSWEHAVEDGIIESEDSLRKWPEMMTVNYDPPMKWGNEPLPKIQRIKE